MKQRKHKGSIKGAKADIQHWQPIISCSNKLNYKAGARSPQNVFVFLWPPPTCPGLKGTRNTDGRRGGSSQHKRLSLILNPVRLQTAANAQAPHPWVTPSVWGKHRDWTEILWFQYLWMCYEILIWVKKIGNEPAHWTFTGAWKATRWEVELWIFHLFQAEVKTT